MSLRTIQMWLRNWKVDLKSIAISIDHITLVNKHMMPVLICMKDFGLMAGATLKKLYRVFCIVGEIKGYITTYFHSI